MLTSYWSTKVLSYYYYFCPLENSESQVLAFQIGVVEAAGGGIRITEVLHISLGSGQLQLGVPHPQQSHVVLDLKCPCSRIHEIKCLL